ncbi:9070_t:CDS:2 [Cetraspora pellucida]|uniref:9070_t:CDS:1 n=1 Tax=Cetraspora pellucida TaxID=1433469 RepID=A0A9N9DM83_9GLOM|nr:9070_t:CDS:2 [Cetraspora pellucida]
MEQSEEKKKKQFEEWKHSIAFITSIVTIFSTIELLIKQYLKPNVLCFLVEQMKESLYYTSTQSLIKEVKSLANNETTLNEDLKDKLDNVTSCTKYFLKNLNQSAINKLQLIATDEVKESVNKEFINKRILYKKNYLEQVCVKENELVTMQEILAQTLAKDNIVEFTNSYKMVGKKRPKRTNQSKNMPQETSSKKKHEYTCKFCKEPGHNIATCLYRI